MPVPAATPLTIGHRRWRAFANAVAFALGINVWISMVILPAWFADALHGSARLAALLPLPVLWIGLRRRAESILLGMFPAAILVPIALAPRLASTAVNSPVRFAVVAIGMTAYLFGVSFFSKFHEPPAPRSIRLLSSANAASASRFQRRERVYWQLTALSIVIPLVLIGWVNHDEAVAAYLAAMYPGRSEAMTTLLTAGAVVLWLGIYQYAFLGTLRPHRIGDRDLIDGLSRTRAEIKTGSLRTRFYIAVLVALVAMLAWVAVRFRG